MATLFLLTIILAFIHPHHSQQDPTSIDLTIRDITIRSYSKHHPTKKTATLYNITLPPSLSNASATVSRFRTGSLRRHGAVIGEFTISPGLIFHPHTKRLILVRQNLGNLSSIYTSYFNHTKFRPLSPVVGLLAYNAARLGHVIDVIITKKPLIRVNFTGIVISTKSKTMCVIFTLNGSVRVSKQTSMSHVCAVRQLGHYALVAVEGRGGMGVRRRLEAWKVVVAGMVAGVLGLALLGLVVVAVVRVKERRWEVAEMERRAREEEALQMSMVGHLRAPMASVARTAPALEDEYACS